MSDRTDGSYIIRSQPGRDAKPVARKFKLNARPGQRCLVKRLVVWLLPNLKRQLPEGLPSTADAHCLGRVARAHRIWRFDSRSCAGVVMLLVSRHALP